MAVLLMSPMASWGQSEAAPQAEVFSETVPDEVLESAVAAVAALGREVVQGRYHVALERMNPKWKERHAKRMGGMKELERQLAAVPAEMMRQGISMVSFKPQGKPRGYGVTPVNRQMKERGATIERLVCTQWLVLVPTVTQFKILQSRPGQPAKWIEIESIGYQVAISDRENLNWTFIDGGGLNANDLRSVFITLPQDMELPPVGKKEAP